MRISYTIIETSLGFVLVAAFIPCHRVIRSNGELGGYHWGRARKQLLLALEHAAETKEAQV